MIGSRTRILRSPEYSGLGVDLIEHLESWIRASEPNELCGLLDTACIGLLVDGFRQVGGCEGAVWLVDRAEENLVAVYNSGDDADSLVGFEQPIGSGIISMVYGQQQPYCENSIGPSAGHDDTLDRKIKKHTSAMIAVPFYFASGLRGVISCVQLAEVETAGARDGFSSNDVADMSRIANIVGRLVDETLLTSVLGLDDAG